VDFLSDSISDVRAESQERPKIPKHPPKEYILGRMPIQTSVSYILLYSHTFFIRVDLRHCFWCFAFLLGTRRPGRVCATEDKKKRQ
jgi:hypothetical protein